MLRVEEVVEDEDEDEDDRREERRLARAKGTAERAEAQGCSNWRCDDDDDDDVCGVATAMPICTPLFDLIVTVASAEPHARDLRSLSKRSVRDRSKALDIVELPPLLPPLLLLPEATPPLSALSVARAAASAAAAAALPKIVLAVVVVVASVVVVVAVRLFVSSAVGCSFRFRSSVVSAAVVAVVVVVVVVLSCWKCEWYSLALSLAALSATTSVSRLTSLPERSVRTSRSVVERGRWTPYWHGW